MKPTISIFEDEIVITTDSFDLILKTGGECKAQSAERRPTPPPSVPPNGGREDYEPYDNMGEIDWDNDPFAPSMDSLEKSIAEYREQHPEQFATPAPPKEGKVKRTRNLAAKPCIVCGNDFKPTWNTQRYCPACKPPKYVKKRKPLADQTAEELEQTLKDIENRRKKPYEFK